LEEEDKEEDECVRERERDREGENGGDKASTYLVTQAKIRSAVVPASSKITKMGNAWLA
jgi:hypothetical protein